MSFLHFSASKHRGVSGFPQPSPSDWQEKSQFGGFLSQVLQGKASLTTLLKVSSAVLAVSRETLLPLSHRTGQTEGTEGTAGEKGNYMLGFADKMNLPAVPEPLSEQKVSVLGFTSAGLGHTAQINP